MTPRESTPSATERARRVRLVLLDSDGVLTDGRIVVSSDGAETRVFDVRDGHAIHLGRAGGLEFGVLSGRESAALTVRANELGITEVHQRVGDKALCLGEILQRRGLGAEAVCFMGDDLVDVPAMRRVGLAAAPADAVAEARQAAHVVTERRGGRGAVRELVEWLLRASGRWDGVTAAYLRDA